MGRRSAWSRSCLSPNDAWGQDSRALVDTITLRNGRLPSQPPDLILHRGLITTLDRANPHRFAVRYLRRGGNIYDLQWILGRASIKTTEIYLDFLDPDTRVARNSPSHEVGTVVSIEAAVCSDCHIGKSLSTHSVPSEFVRIFNDLKRSWRRGWDSNPR